MPPLSGTRRTLLTGSVAVAGSGSAVLLPSTADAAVSYRAARYRGRRKLLSAADRHLVNRFSYGVTPALTQQVRRAGGAEKWFARQLRPGRVSDRGVPNHFGWWSGLSRGPAELWKRQAADVEGVWEVTADYARACLLRRTYSRRQVLEVMTEFWENHLHVPVDGDAHGLFRASYGRTIRKHALGRFDQMLQATTVHPAMLVYLDGAVSTARHPNENLGRELLELHTVGRGAYTEADVRGSARILTGWHVDMWKTWKPSYVPADHATGSVSVVGFKHPNRSRDGRAVTMAYLAHLAHHPATARHLARKLAVKFVRDNPSPALVSRLARVYLKNDTAIAPVLRALVASKEFKRSAGDKVRDPGEDLVATLRVLGVRVARPPEGRKGDEYAATQVLWQASSIGTTPFGWPRPDGQPIDSESWSSPSRLIASMQVHYSLSGGWWPKTGIAYRKPRQWLPRRSIRFDQLVDHLSQQLLGRHSTKRLLAACCQAVDVRPHERITADHGLVKWSFPRLLVTFLDTPTHLTR
ncbi:MULTISPECIES: DUF1800 domain-containing protein [unclassified Nocardioides]|uniref:DUF1800 domain-containing protein n=1 Tax=unclassified Nocardioides TaxID=2615069 RepID=UPI003014B164